MASASEDLQAQLDDLANLASALESSTSRTSEDALLLGEDQELPEISPAEISNHGDGFYESLRNLIWCSTPEQTPLLPVHSSPTSPASPTSPREPDPECGRKLIEFIWSYILTASMRRYLAAHKTTIVIITILLLIVLLVISYFTGTFWYLVLFLKPILCWIIRWGYDREPGFC